MPTNKESLKDEFIKEFFTDVGFTSKVYTFKVFCDNPDKIYDFFTSHFSQTIDKMVEEIESKIINWKFKKGECSQCDYLEHCGEYHHCESFNQALSLAKGIVLKGKEILK